MSKVIAAYGGGFKPPTKGHLEVVKRALAAHPEIDEFIIYVGGKERDGIGQTESLLIWDIFKKYLPMKVKIEPSKLPIGDIIRLGKNNPEDKVLFVIGGREGRQDDLDDIANRTKNIEQTYPNMEVTVQTTPDEGMSGTNARKATKISSDKLSPFLPDELTDNEKEEVFKILRPVIKEEISKSQLNAIEAYADKLFAKLGIDIEFTKHFLDRVNDERNKKPISVPELMGMFKRLHRKHGKPLSKVDDDFDAVVKDFNNNINIPFAINVTPNDIDLVAKTVMRKKDFKTSTPVIALNENASYQKDINLIEKLATLTQHMLDKGMNIEPLPNLEFVNGDSENARDFFGKTAYYNPTSQTIVLYTEGRHPKDIARSYAHEMIHHIQNLEGRLGNITTTNTQEDDDLNKIEAEANLNGTMTFRNWTDSINEYITPADKSKVDSKELKMGIEVEMEHTNDPKEAEVIALQHLAEDPKYYTKLATLGLEEKKVKDPFGLNQFAREIAEGVLNEGRYDSLSRELASITLNAWKSDFKDGAKYGYFEGKITPEEYPTDLTFTFKALGKFVDDEYTHNGYSKSDGEVGVEYEIPKDSIPQIWEEVYMDLISTIRHEIEHQTQGGKNVKQGKGMTSDQKLRQLIKKGGGDIVRYVTLPKEIESNVQGLYLKAKKWRRPYDEVVDEYIKDFLKVTNPADVNYIKTKWQQVAKKRSLPSLLNEGRYDTLANQLSKIVFEAFKDIHDRGDKKGEFEFRVNHPEEEHDIPSEEFYFDLAGTVKITDDEYEVNGGANAGFDRDGNEITPLLSVEFKIPKNPNWQRVSFDIKDVIRHELEHLTQDGDNEKGGVISDDPKLARPSKYMKDDQLIRDLIDADLLPKSQYFKLEKEVDAMLQGLYFKAKKAKRPFKDVINDYLNIFIDQETITQEEKENILNIWRSRNKALSLPLFENEQDMDYKIFSDMDGVITDFNNRYKKYAGMMPSEYEKKFGKDKFWELADAEGVAFWVGMPWMEDGKKYWDYIKDYNVELLSSPSRSETSRLGKRLWVRNNLPGIKLTLAQAYNKQNYAAPNHILIDDRKSNIEQWRDKGGIGILHTSAEDTIKQLKDLGL